MTSSPDPILPGGEAITIRKAIVAAMPVNVPVRGRMATAIMESVVQPILDDLAQLQSDRTRLEAENERLKAALKPFAALSFTFDRFSFDPAELVFTIVPMARFWPTEHAAFEALIDAARAALAQPQPEERGPLPLDPSPQGEGGGEQGAPASPSGSQATPEAPTDPRPTGVDPSRGPAAQSCLDAAAAIEGIAQELDAYGRTAQGHILRCALDALLDVRTEGPLPPADESTEWLVSRARARFQAAIVKGEAGQ